MTAVTFLRVRDRLENAGLQLDLYVESDGFRWDIGGRPLHARRVFPTVQEALEHADTYTHFWYEARQAASPQLPTPQLKPALSQTAVAG
jgi:hypothetical protein